MPPEPNPTEAIEGQLNAQERELLTKAILNAASPPKVALEVGTWLGGGSTLHILRALERNRGGHLWGIEASREIYDRMLANLRRGAPDAVHRFTPLFGLSQNVIPAWLADQPPEFQIDFAFLDGGNNPLEQVREFQLIEAHIPVGGQVMAHDAKMRKGKWLMPYLRRLDNWQTRLYDVSTEGLLHAEKIAAAPSPVSLTMARRGLFKARLQPAEVAAAFLPAPVCWLILRLLPGRTSARLAEGRVDR